MVKVVCALLLVGVTLSLAACSNEWQLDSDADDPLPALQYCIKIDNERACSGSFLKLGGTVLQLLDCGGPCGPYQMDFVNLRELAQGDAEHLAGEIQWIYLPTSEYWLLASQVHAKQPVVQR
jgi:hypothetical protein